MVIWGKLGLNTSGLRTGLNRIEYPRYGQKQANRSTEKAEITTRRVVEKVQEMILVIPRK